MTRERAVKEKRAMKQERKDEKKRVAAEAREREALGLPPLTDETVDEEAADGDEVPEPERL